MACAPKDALFVGDTDDADVDGPIAFGMQAFHLGCDKTGTAKVRNASLSELAAVMETLLRQPRV